MSNQVRETSTHEFIDDKLKFYSAHSNVRGIPFIGDGFKQAQRKAMWGMIDRGENSEKDTVERISAQISASTDSHHGTTSMEGTVVCLAQSFAGSNNIPLIEGAGQFGNRLSRKASSSRYIKAKLSPNFRKLFKKEDDLILEHHYSNNLKIEPKYFIPLLPISLINGAEGMGTGHSTYILGYSAEKLRVSVLALLNNKTLDLRDFQADFNGFKGTIQRDPITAQVIITGVATVTPNQIHITELPIGIQNDDYEKHLKSLIDKDIIKDYTNSSDEESGFDIVIQAPRTTTSLSKDDLYKVLKLVSKETENLTLWDTSGRIRKYNNVIEIIEEFVEWRLLRYEERRQALIKLTVNQIDWIEERIKFIEYYLNNSQGLKSKGKKELFEILSNEGFVNIDKLLSMQIWSLTKDHIDDLIEQLSEKTEYLVKLNNDTPKDMYTRELKELKF